MPVFILEVKKENSTKKKNEHGDICFLNNYKFLYKITFKVISFFVSVITLCDIFYSRFKRFLCLNALDKKGFSLKISYMQIFVRYFCFHLLANSMLRIPRKKYGFSHVQFVRI